jgi:predicted nucleic acid-binding protein
MTVVIDTNVFLAAAFWKGVGRKCWALCAGRHYLLFLITRDSDLLSLGKPFGIIVITDEQFLKLAKTF